MRVIKHFFLIVFVVVALSKCNNDNCGCNDPDFGYFNIYLKSSSNTDLLNPQTGIYNPSEVIIYEAVNGQRGPNLIPALTNQNTGYKYVLNNGKREGVYFIVYYCSIYKYQGELISTLVQFKPGAADTLTFTYTNHSNHYPEQVFYNHHLVWELGDGPPEFTIEK